MYTPGLESNIFRFPPFFNLCFWVDAKKEWYVLFYHFHTDFLVGKEGTKVKYHENRNIKVWLLSTNKEKFSKNIEDTSKDDGIR